MVGELKAIGMGANQKCAYGACQDTLPDEFFYMLVRYSEASATLEWRDTAENKSGDSANIFCHPAIADQPNYNRFGKKIN